MVPVGALTPHERNINEGDLGAIIESVGVNRFYGAVLAQKSTGKIIAGKHRWLAAKDQGLELVPVLWMDVDDAMALRIMLADNRTSRLGTDNQDQLAGLLQDILNDQGTLSGTGYDGEFLDELLADLATGGLPQDGGEDESGQLTTQFQVLVKCASELSQGELLERLIAEGYECRALIS